jgi:predicted O-methyltransferase YrrM
VHSPFVFNLINSIFREENYYYIYNNVENQRKHFLNNETKIYVEDLGTGKNAVKKIKDIARSSVENKKYSQLLFRLINYLKPKTILELGTSLGLTTMYLAGANSKSQCITIEGSPLIHDEAVKTFLKNRITNIEAHCGNIDDTLPILLDGIKTLDFVYFDANHQKESTLKYFSQCLEKKGEKATFVFDDIYWSKGMTKAWKQIKQHPDIRVSIDVFHLGILFFDPELQKGDYIIRF